MTNLQGRAVAVLVSLMMVACVFAIQTNSRTSILVKEATGVAGAALLMAVLFATTAAGGVPRWRRLSPAMAALFLAIPAWMLVRHLAGTGSVNGPKVMYYLLAMGGTAGVMAVTMTRPDRDTLLWVMVCATSLLATYAVLQGLGITVMSWDSSLIAGARSSGTMGNPNLLGSFAAAMTPVGVLFLLSRERLGSGRLVLAVLFGILCVAAVVASKTRGSLIGLGLASVLLLAHPRMRRKGLNGMMVPLLMILLFAAGALMLQGRLAELSAAEGESGTLMVRRLIWSGGLRMVGERPLAGWGPGAFQIVFPPYRDPAYHLLGVSHNTLHAHCEYLEILVDIGIVGLGLWAALAAVAAGRVRRAMRAAKESGGGEWLVLAGLVGGVVALLGEATVSVALRWAPSGLLLALLAGMLLSSAPERAGGEPGRRRLGLTLPLLAAAALLAAVALPNYLLSMRAGRQLFKGKDMALTRIQPEMTAAVQTAGGWSSTGNPALLEQAYQHFRTAEAYADSSVKWCTVCVETNPDELGGWYALGSAYLTRGMLYRRLSQPMMEVLEAHGRDPYDYGVASQCVLGGIAAYDSLAKRAPYYAEMHNNLGLAWSSLGEVDLALSSIRVAYGLHAHNRQSYVSQTGMMAPLTDSPDAVHILWTGMLDVPDGYFEGMSPDKREEVVHSLLTFSATAMHERPVAADSLEVELGEMTEEMAPALSGEVTAGLALQGEYMDEALELALLVEQGDTAAAAAVLSETPPQALGALPSHAAAEALLGSREDSGDHAWDLAELWGDLVHGCTASIRYWPLRDHLMTELPSAVLRDSLATAASRNAMLNIAITSLTLDRLLFQVQQLTSSTPEYLQRVPSPVIAELDDVWAGNGGPLYCFSGGWYGDGADGVCDLFAPGSVLGGISSGMRELRLASPEDPDLILAEIGMGYCVFLSFYTGVPVFSSDQSRLVLSDLRKAREALTSVLGNEEASYRVSSVLGEVDVMAEGMVNPDYSQLLESLRADLVTGELPAI